MELGSFYRSKALDHRARREPIDRLADVTVPYDWLVLALLAAVCAVIVGWGALGEVERTLRTDAVIVALDDRRAVVAPAAGRLAEILVVTGDRVNEGEPLARVLLPELEGRLAAARERERVILAEPPGGAPEAGLRQMLVDARAEVAALTAMIAHGSVIASPFAGEVIAHRLSFDAMVAAGEEVARVRVGRPVAPVAVASLPSAASVPPGARARLHCGGTGDQGVIETSVTELSPPTAASAGRLADAGLEPDGQRVLLSLPDAATVAEGDRCELHIVVETRAPLQFLLAATRPD